MTARWPRFVSLALVLVTGCDREQTKDQAEAVPASSEPAPVQAPAQAPSEAPSEASENHAGSGVAKPTVPPEPGAQPGTQGAVEPGTQGAVEPGSGYYSTAADELAAIYASLAPGSASAEEIGKQAWAHLEAEEFHEAGQAFARLTKLEPEVWKHPFNAACAATRRRDLDRAQIFLVEALRRGGDEVRTKARKDGDLDLLRLCDYFEVMLTAGPDELAAWEIREPSFELLPYPLGEAALVIHELSAKFMPAEGGRYYAPDIAVNLKVERVKSAREDLRVAVTCKSHGQYLHNAVLLNADEYKLAVGKTETYALRLFNIGWVGTRTLNHCEIYVGGRDPRNYGSPYRLIGSYCAVGDKLSEGPCADFERPIHRMAKVVEVGAEALIDAVAQTPRFDFWITFELGVRPDFLHGLHATVTCKVGGKTKVQSMYISSAGGLELARPGEAIQSLDSLSFDELPTWCQIEYYLENYGPRDLVSVPTYCYENGRLEPRSCS